MQPRLTVDEAWQEVNLQALEAELEHMSAEERRGRGYFFGRMFAPQSTFPSQRSSVQSCCDCFS